MKQLKTVVVFVVLFFIGIVVVWFFSRSQTPTQKPVAPQHVPLIPTVALMDNPTGVIFTSAIPPLPLPDALPVYVLDSSAWNPAEAGGLLAKHFGLAGEPRPLAVEGGSLLLWQDGSMSVVADETKKMVTFVDAAPGKTGDTKQILASVGLSDLVPLLVPLDQGVVDTSNQPSLSGASGQRSYSSFGLSLDSYPVYEGVDPAPQVQMTTTAAGAVASFSVRLAGLPKETGGRRALLSLSDALSLLNSGRGQFLSFTQAGEERGETSVAPDFRSVALAAVSVGYFPYPDEEIYRPVFLFEGRATATAGVSGTVHYLLAATD